MANEVLLTIREANLLRVRMGRLLKTHREFLQGADREAIHDFRVASRRFREIIDHLEPTLTAKWHQRLGDSARRITRILGKPREAEINLQIVRTWRDRNLIDPLAAEFLIKSQQDLFNKKRLKSIKKLSRKSVGLFEDFLSRLKGSRTAQPTQSPVLASRCADFLGFSWHTIMDDEHLHDLRIRAKKFRYALEIDSRLGNRRVGRLLNRIRKLQDRLGEIHDLYVLSLVIQDKRTKWESADLQLIPAALESAYNLAIREKAKLYPLIYPLYSGIVRSLPPDLLAFAASQPAPANAQA
ncbi:MAG TPA: CHAD domain-containing protein [Acidobacteriota bacterium]|nr:CHAD domain-containing protein [Acidobacteriota bacterium]